MKQHSQWCRFETDVAHNILMDQNREGLILVKIEDVSLETLESLAPQLHFLLKTRIYLEWRQSDARADETIFWKKVRRALGFSHSGPYGTVKQYYHNYWFSKSTGKTKVKSQQQSPQPYITSSPSALPLEAATDQKLEDDRDFMVPTLVPGSQNNNSIESFVTDRKNDSSGIKGQKSHHHKNRQQAAKRPEAIFICMKDLLQKEGAEETESKTSSQNDSAISNCDSPRISTDVEDDEDEATFADIEEEEDDDDEQSTSGCESLRSSLRHGPGSSFPALPTVKQLSQSEVQMIRREAERISQQIEQEACRLYSLRSNPCT